MNETLPKESLQWATQNTLNKKIISQIFNSAKAKLVRLPLLICIFALSLFASQDVQAQTYTGSYTFGNNNQFSFDYTIEYSTPAPSTSALITVDFTTALPGGLSAQKLRIGTPTTGFSFVNMSGSNPFTYTMSGANCCPTPTFIFRMVYENGGLFESPNQNPILPISLSNFSASAVGSSAAELNWNTSTEINSDYFAIERSIDGQVWDLIGEVQAAGNSNADLAYSFTDKHIISNRSAGNIYYYRLKMTDLDATYEYSDIRGVNFASNNNTTISVFPNPTIDRINVDLSAINLDAGNVDLSLFDNTGRQVYNKTVKGTGIELIDVSNLKASTYHVVLTQGSERIHQTSIIKAN